MSFSIVSNCDTHQFQYIQVPAQWVTITNDIPKTIFQLQMFNPSSSLQTAQLSTYGGGSTQVNMTSSDYVRYTATGYGTIGTAARQFNILTTSSAPISLRISELPICTTTDQCSAPKITTGRNPTTLTIGLLTSQLTGYNMSVYDANGVLNQINPVSRYPYSEYTVTNADSVVISDGIHLKRIKFIESGIYNLTDIKDCPTPSILASSSFAHTQISKLTSMIQSKTTLPVLATQKQSSSKTQPGTTTSKISQLTSSLAEKMSGTRFYSQPIATKLNSQLTVLTQNGGASKSLVATIVNQQLGTLPILRVDTTYQTYNLSNVDSQTSIPTIVSSRFIIQTTSTEIADPNGSSAAFSGGTAMLAIYSSIGLLGGLCLLALFLKLVSHHTEKKEAEEEEMEEEERREESLD